MTVTVTPDLDPDTVQSVEITGPPPIPPAPTPASMPAQRTLPPAPKLVYPAPGTRPEYHERRPHMDVDTTSPNGTPAGSTFTRKTVTEWIDWHVDHGWKLQAADETSAVITRYGVTRVVYPCPHRPD